MTVRSILGPVLFLCISGAMTACSFNTAWGGLLDVFNDDPVNGLTNREIVEGLKAALEKGSGTAINTLGQTDGYYRNVQAHIGLPDKLEKAEKVLRELQQDAVLDEFILAMNRAAEQAVPEATTIFREAIREMTIRDAISILDGADDAATRHFRRTSGEKLSMRMLPLVRQATANTGVTARYKNLVEKLGFASAYLDTESLNLDRYVTDEAINGLFKLLAGQEKLIRHDPAARTSEILQKVFGR